MIANRTLRVLGKTIYAGETLPVIPQEQADRLIKAGAVTVVAKEEPKPEPKQKAPAKKRTTRKKKVEEAS